MADVHMRKEWSKITCRSTVKAKAGGAIADRAPTVVSFAIVVGAHQAGEDRQAARDHEASAENGNGNGAIGIESASGSAISTDGACIVIVSLRVYSERFSSRVLGDLW